MIRSFVFLFVNVIICHSQQENVENDILTSFRSYNITKSEKLLKLLDDSKMKKLLKIELTNLKEGIIDTTFLYYNLSLSGNTNQSFKEQIVFNYLLGDYYLKYKENDSIADSYYNRALEVEKNSKISFATNHVLLKLNYLLLKNGKDIELFGKTVERYKSLAKKDVDKFWAQYYSILNQFFVIRKQKKTIDEINLDEEFIQGYQYANNEYLKGILHQLQGIYYDALKKDFYKSRLNYGLAKEIYAQFDHFEARKRLLAVKTNLGIILYNEGEYSEAISIFRNVLTSSITSNGQIDKLRISEWLIKSYDSVKKYDSAYFFSKRMNFIEDSLDQIEHSKVIRENNIVQRERELLVLSKKNESLTARLITLIPFLLILALASLIFFFFYKRYKKRSTNLEEEQSETLQKLDELKNIVIKNHIILKDKTKVYISDLMYIKSDDHYLNIFLTDGKNHFVRGKLNQIKEELPPNFIRCHRSYIVNSNFVKQINSDSLTLIDKTQVPLSRSYKNKF